MKSEGRCFLCSSPSSHHCPYCGEDVCSQVHYEYHRPVGEESRVSSTVPTSSDQTLCQPYRLLCGDKGRYLVATRDIKPGQLIITDKPCVVGPPAKTVPVCLECLAPLTPSSPPCPRCSLPLCGPLCFSGPHHLQECSLLSSSHHSISIKDFSSPHILYSAIVPLRMWLLKTNNNTEWQKVNFLQEGDSDELGKSKMWNDVADYIRNVMNIKDFSTKEVLRLTGIKATNANSLEPTGVSGTGLYPLYPLMNSYCYCNTMYTIDKVTKVMEVRAQRLIHAGEEITTRYVIPMMGQPARSNYIWNNWGFICSCERCSDPTELGTMYGGVRCCDEGYFLPAKLCKPGDRWQCDKCEEYIEEEDIIARLDKLKKLIDNTNLSDAEEGEKLIKYLGLHLHHNHEYILRVKTQLLQLYTTEHKDSTRPVLDRRLQLALDILQVTEVLDPGLTPRRGGLLKHVVDITMMKANMDCGKGLLDKEILKKKMRNSLGLMKEMMQCLKYNTAIANNVNNYL